MSDKYDEQYILRNDLATDLKIRVIASDRNWVEGEAVRQLEKTAELPGMRLAVGLPDLHPEKGKPIGAAYLTEGLFYPYLIGNDIGCGMGFFQTDLRQNKIKLDKWTKKLGGMEQAWEGNTEELLRQFNIESTECDMALGTIGGGNHFAELQKIESIFDQEVFDALGLDQKCLQLLVHSGSRGLGESILRSHVDKHRDGYLKEDTDEARSYLERHDHAVAWAKANRHLIANRIISPLGGEVRTVLDQPHNILTQMSHRGQSLWLHRKGAAPSDSGAAIIPGSRATLSYLVIPLTKGEEHGYSLAHGAGRRWKRSDVKQRLEKRYSAADLTHTDLGGRVICEDKKLLYEEAPQAYKDIDVVVQDMVDAGMVQIVASMRPIITYKMRKHT